MADWMAYGSTVASNPNEKFGIGNVKGVVGGLKVQTIHKKHLHLYQQYYLEYLIRSICRTILMGLFLYIGIDLGSSETFYDNKLFDSMAFAFLLGTLITNSLICYILAYYSSYLAKLPYKYYFPFILIVIVWATLQYTGGWEDIAVLTIFSIVGIIAKKYKFNRSAFTNWFLLSDRIYSLTYQLTTLHTIHDLITKTNIHIHCIINNCNLILVTHKKE